MLSGQYLEWIWQGYQVTVVLSLLSCLLASLMGAVLCAMRISPVSALNRLARAYIAVFRNTPLLVQLFFWYFGVSGFLPQVIKDWLLTPHEWRIASIAIYWPSYEFIYGFIGLAFYTAAYIAEELRAGIRTVAQGQKHAAYALGFKPLQAFFIVILPQAIRNAASPLAGQYMIALKNSSLAAAIGVSELFYVASQIETRSLMAFQVYFAVTLCYVATIGLIEAALLFAEMRGRKRPGQKVPS
ncbi:MAG: His/Glu/Gln/Arg/opine family amino ABC transporter permease, 3-TM region [Candidatus Tokpelaia hoelldobleri]|uniref:His/Glu/Gln/Arg/opine family amino ABC transporter permease, 3-TM region n=1 Tax=Candidatus Tokpelaia hoelldobleri TaxID=1902579 RepID=A0A1U9JV85_9HYPH|nr:MAG: His/Glu/Gln/Arg/opine family amino ABC transporter permease, 3-TM region [Candidatus Tokpelaia hoelldoblerii]